jgi:hypothetical protein
LLEVALLLLVATALHLGVERPFLALRDRRERSWKEPVVAPTPTLPREREREMAEETGLAPKLAT